METHAASHPSTDVLLALGSGQLDDATEKAVYFHVEVCPNCFEAVGRLKGGGFLDRLRAGCAACDAPAPGMAVSSIAASGNTVPMPPRDGQAAIVILPELRDHPQYEVLRELGRGGMGVVYLAMNKLMDRLEVLKVVNKQLLGEADAAERFLREIRAAAHLNHPNIVTAYSALQTGDILLFSMEFIEGQDLAKVVKARGPLPASEAGSYVVQAARGLQHAFEKGMVHRDIKPQNLILDGKKNVVKILDFGLAKATHSMGGVGEGLTGLNMMMGTPDYMAPEQARDAAHVDIRADVYSLGCTFYCLLAGRVPFVGNSLAAKIADHQLREPEPIESLRQDLPPGLGDVVRRMMAKDRANRYREPEEAAQALTSCFKEESRQPASKAPPVNVDTIKPITATNFSLPAAPKSISERNLVVPAPDRRQLTNDAPSPIGRKRGLIGTGAAVVVLALAGLIGLWAAGVFRVKTADGVLVVHVNEPNADVYVDGDRMTVSWAEGGKNAVIRVRPGTRKVEVKKDGFTAFGEEVTLEDGGNLVVTARLDPTPPPARENPPIVSRTAPAPPVAPSKLEVADKPPVQETKKDDKDWVQLFNGKDLAGWKTHPSQPGQWRVDKGILIGSGAGANLYTERGDFENFHLRIEGRIKSGVGNVFFRCGFGPIIANGLPTWPPGYGIRISGNDPRYVFFTGSLAHPNDMLSASRDNLLVKEPLHKPEEWFTLEAIAEGTHLITKVDGKTAVDFVDDKHRYPSGHLALDSWSPIAQVEFRKVEIKILSPSSPVAPSKPDVVQKPPPEVPKKPEKEWVQLFNGKNLTGWKTYTNQPGNWRVEKGVLIGSGKGENLFTERGDFENFRLRAEARVNDQGIGGIFFRCKFDLIVRNGRPLWPHGYSVRISGNGPRYTFYTGSLSHPNDMDARNALFGRESLVVKEPLHKPDEWFTLELLAEGNHLVTKVNDKTAVDFIDDKPRYSSGHLALNSFAPSTQIEFREIEIKELAPASPVAPSKMDGVPTSAAPAGPFQAKSVWVNDKPKMTLTVTERKGETFRAHFEFGDKIEREVAGTVQGNKVSWFAKDVRVIRGGAGGDNYGTIAADTIGDKIDFIYRDDPIGGSGSFTLRLKKDK